MCMFTIRMDTLVLWILVLASARLGNCQNRGESCRRLEILRKYANADGTFRISGEKCDDTPDDAIYIRESPVMYFYRLYEGRWAIYEDKCDSNNYGPTDGTHSSPWTMKFQNAESSAITCTEYSWRYRHHGRRASRVIHFPPMYVEKDIPDASYQVNVTLPSGTEFVEYKPHVSGSCTSGNLTISFHNDTGTYVVREVDLCGSPDTSNGVLYFSAEQYIKAFSLYASIHLTAKTNLSVSLNYNVNSTGDDYTTAEATYSSSSLEDVTTEKFTTSDEKARPTTEVVTTSLEATSTRIVTSLVQTTAELAKISTLEPAEHLTTLHENIFEESTSMPIMDVTTSQETVTKVVEQFTVNKENDPGTTTYIDQVTTNDDSFNVYTTWSFHDDHLTSEGSRDTADTTPNEEVTASEDRARLTTEVEMTSLETTFTGMVTSQVQTNAEVAKISTTEPAELLTTKQEIVFGESASTHLIDATTSQKTVTEVVEQFTVYENNSDNRETTVYIDQERTSDAADITLNIRDMIETISVVPTTTDDQMSTELGNASFDDKTTTAPAKTTVIKEVTFSSEATETEVVTSGLSSSDGQPSTATYSSVHDIMGATASPDTTVIDERLFTSETAVEEKTSDRLRNTNRHPTSAPDIVTKTPFYIPGVKVCDQGHFVDNLTRKCKPCSAGFYQDDYDGSPCKPCESGHYQRNAGQSVCTACPPGTYQPHSGEVSCIHCPLGNYQPQEGSNSCEACPQNRRTKTSGAISEQDCNVFFCPSGYEESSPGSGLCAACGYDSYKDNAEDPLGRCQPCRTGLITLEEFSTSADMCIPDPCDDQSCVFGAICIHGRCQCPPSCPHQSDGPVCGSDGITYTSRCDLESQSCHKELKLTQLYEGPCSNDTCEGMKCKCGMSCVNGQCICPEPHKPVCADDNKTYRSACDICNTGKQLTILYWVPCENVPTLMPDFAEVKESGDTIQGQYLIYIFVAFGVIITTVIIIIATVCIVRHKKEKEAQKEDAMPMLNPAARTFSSSSQNQRITVESRPDTPVEIDRLSGCITPFIDDNQTFDFDVKPNGATPRCLSSTDTSQPEMTVSQSPAVIAGLDGTLRTSCSTPGPERVPSTKRAPSVVFNNVYEKKPETEAVIEIDDVFQPADVQEETFQTKL